jgi:bacterioferritin-associated ferredoxin
MYICLCKGLTESDVRKVAMETALNPEALIQRLGLDETDCCGRCARNIESFAAMTSCPLPCHTTEPSQKR